MMRVQLVLTKEEELELLASHSVRAVGIALGGHDPWRSGESSGPGWSRSGWASIKWVVFLRD